MKLLNVCCSARRLANLMILPVLFMILTGCSSVQVKETWSNPAAAGHHYKKLMIVAILADKNRRTLLENVVVDEMSLYGVSAVASNALVKDMDTAKREDIVAAVRTTGSDAVITVRPLDVGDTKVSQQGIQGALYGTASSGYYSLPSATSYIAATLQTNLYDAGTAEIVWTATIRTYDVGHEARVSRDLARYYIERLRRDGFL